MGFIFIITFIHLLGVGLTQNTTQNRISFVQGAQTVLSSVAEAVDKTVEDIPILKNTIAPFCVEPPQECPNHNITFWYFSRSQPNTSIQVSVIDPNSFNHLPRNQHPWKVIIHGYTKSKDDVPNPQLRSAYFQHGDYNLLSVDYSPIAKDRCYIQSVHNAPLIANCTAQMLDALIDRNFFSSDNLHVIGFSLGAQVAGLVHDYMKNEKPGRVTGLDPAAPLFDGIINDKLTEESGKFVDVIHTNGAFNGKKEVSGHVDFYVNGGLNQPGCLTNKNKSQGSPNPPKKEKEKEKAKGGKKNRGQRFKPQGPIAYSSCSHERGPLYFAESINSPDGFWGIPCSSYLKFYSKLCNTQEANLIPMGEYVPHTARGKYYLQTSDKSPYALGKMISTTA